MQIVAEGQNMKIVSRWDPEFLISHANVLHTSTSTIAIQKGLVLVSLSNGGSQSTTFPYTVPSRFESGS